jgi:hypothetical protein
MEVLENAASTTNDFGGGCALTTSKAYIDSIGSFHINKILGHVIVGWRCHC